MANGNRAQQRDWHKLSAGENAIEIVHVDGDQFQIRSLLCQIVQTAFEFSHLTVRRATTFGKDDERIHVSDFSHHDIDRALMHFDLLSVDQDGIEGLGQKSAKRRRSPIVLSRNRPRELPESLRETRPEHNRIQMAGVVREVDSLSRVRFGANPSHREAAHQFGS